MAEDLKKMYRTVMDDHFPDSLRMTFGDQEMVYRKRTWKFPDSKGELIEKGLRYGENPGQEAALYELVGGNLILGGCRFIDPGSGLVSAIREEDMLQEGKHPGKTNLTDLDNGLNIMKYLMDKPAAAILKHNNPCGVAYGATLAEAYRRANRADRIAAFGGCLVLNRPVDKETAALIAENYLEVVGAPDYEEGTLEILKGRSNLRIIQLAKIDRLTDYLSRRFVDIKSLIDGGIIVQQSPLNKVKGAGDLMPRRNHLQGQDLPDRAAADRAGNGGPPLRLVCRAGGDLQLGALRQGRVHRGDRHGRAGSRRGGGNRRLQGVPEICRCPLLR